MTKKKLILCQPDDKKGCSLCCGLFNHKNITKENLTIFLNEGKKRSQILQSHENWQEPNSVRDITSHVCPYQGFLKNGKPGCLIHPLFINKDERNRSLFSAQICDKFLCPAHEILSIEEKQALISNVDDWHLYSTAIADPYSFSILYEACRDIAQGKLNKSLLNYGLLLHSKNLQNYDGDIFFYSLPEYKQNCKEFSLKYRREIFQEIFKEILQFYNSKMY